MSSGERCSPGYGTVHVGLDCLSLYHPGDQDSRLTDQ